MTDFDRQPHPVNLTSPVELRGQDLPPVTRLARRAGCIERCLSSSTEACWSNPVSVSCLCIADTEQIIPAFYPMAFLHPRERGRCGKTLVITKAVIFKAGDADSQMRAE